MDIKIISKHLEITDAIRAKIEEKVEKLPKYFDSITNVKVVVDGHEGGIDGSVEIIASAEHNCVFVAKDAGGDIYHCIDEAVKKIERQLTKYKEKQRDNKHSGIVLPVDNNQDEE